MMLYYDTSYLVKCYLNERGSREVRSLLEGDVQAACLEYGRVELAAALHRHMREGRLTRTQYRIVCSQAEDDDNAHVWTWLPLSRAVLGVAQGAFARMPRTAFLRSADALHLAAAAEYGFREIYTHDAHMLAAAHVFGVRGVDVLERS